MNRERQDTLPGVPLPDGEPPTPLKDELQELVRQAVAEAFKPYGEMWTRRAQDMLEVLAEATHSRVQVRSSVRIVKAMSCLVVLILFGAAVSLFVVLDAERGDRRRAVQMQEGRRDSAVEQIDAHVDAVCGRR